MDKLTKKTLKVSRGYTYTYYTSPAKDGKPTCFLAHGWCDSAELWSAFTNDYLVPHGYGVIVPDCLGYAGTDKPTDWEEYDMKKMTADAVEIVDKESVQNFVSIGHDWGTALAQRLYNFYPDRVIGLILVSVAYIPPGPFDFEQSQELGKQVIGYPQYYYWLFFTADDGPAIMNQNVESVFEAEHGIPSTWMNTFCREDGMREFVSNGKHHELESYVTDEYKSKWVERVSRDKFDGPNCWYKCWMRGPHHEEAMKNMVVNVPVLYYGGKNDMVCRPEFIKGAQDAGLLPQSKVVTTDAGHYCMYKDPQHFGESLSGWLKENF